MVHFISLPDEIDGVFFLSASLHREQNTSILKKNQMKGSQNYILCSSKICKNQSHFDTNSNFVKENRGYNEFLIDRNVNGKTNLMKICSSQQQS